MKKIWDFLKDEDGLELAEYAVMGALIILVAAGTITTLGGSIDGVFDSLNTRVTTAGDAGG
jgi:pilus assembly protein Flp/PilA